MNIKTADRILVVDDEEVFRNMLRKALSMEGYTVDTAADGLEAIELLPEGNYSVVLSDIMMPRADGIEVLKAVKRIDADIPVILITGYASLDSALAAIREGAYDYLTKPFQLEEIKLTVANAVEKRRLLAENGRLMESLKEAYHKIDTLMKSRSKMSRALEDIDEELERRQRGIYEGMQVLRTAVGIRGAAMGGERSPTPRKMKAAADQLEKNQNAGDEGEVLKKQVLGT